MSKSKASMRVQQVPPMTSFVDNRGRIHLVRCSYIRDPKEIPSNMSCVIRCCEPVAYVMSIEGNGLDRGVAEERLACALHYRRNIKNLEKLYRVQASSPSASPKQQVQPKKLLSN